MANMSVVQRLFEFSKKQAVSNDYELTQQLGVFVFATPVFILPGFYFAYQFAVRGLFLRAEVNFLWCASE